MNREASLSPGDERLLRFARSALDGIVVIDAAGTILDWSPGQARITGIDEAEAIGRPIWDVQVRLAPADARSEALRAALRERCLAGLKEGDTLRRVLEDEIERPDGERRRVQSVLFPFEGPDGPLVGAILRDVTAHAAADERRARRLRMLASELSHAETQERRRLARILHDHVQQLLVAVKLNLDRIDRGIDEALPGSVGARTALEEAIAAVRSLAVDLNPPILQEGLAAALEWLAERLRKRKLLEVKVNLDPAAEPASEALRACLFDAVRELLLNVAKHSGVHEAAVSLARDEQGIGLVVEDSGSGFDPEAAPASTDAATGLGLQSLSRRLKALGCDIGVWSEPGRGTRITLRAPG